MSTERLQLPTLVSGQSQKEVTINMSFQRLDALIQTAVESSSLTTPPTGVNGKIYLVPAGATGVWEGKQNNIAHFVGGAWTFYLPFDGMRVWDIAESRPLFYKEGSWQAEPISPEAMIASIYDSDGDGKVNAADTADKASVNTFPVGDGTDATILIQAYNADANKPGIRYDATSSKWQYSNDGAVWKDIGANDGVSTFKTISVASQSDVVADVADDTVTLAAGNNITITTDANTDTITISSNDEEQVSLSSGVTAVAGNLLCLTATGYVLASNADLSTVQGIVLCKTGGTGTATAIETGYYDTGTISLTAGEAVYVGVDGSYTQTAPTASGSFIKCIGWAVSTSTIRFRPDTLAVQNA